MKKIVSIGLLSSVLLSTSLMADPDLMVGLGGKYNVLDIKEMGKNNTISALLELGFVYENTHYITLKSDFGGSGYKFGDVKLTDWDVLANYKYKWLNRTKFSPFISGGTGMVFFDSSGSKLDSGNFNTKGLLLSGALGAFYDIDRNWELELSFNYSRNFVDFEYETGGYFVPQDKYSTSLQMNYKW